MTFHVTFLILEHSATKLWHFLWILVLSNSSVILYSTSVPGILFTIIPPATAKFSTIKFISCNKTFENQTMLEEHKVKDHRLKCSVCSNVENTQEELKKMTFSKIGYTWFTPGSGKKEPPSPGTLRGKLNTLYIKVAWYVFLW